MPRPLPAFFLLLPLVGGCAATGSCPLGPLVVGYAADGTATVVEAPRQATYVLCQPSATGGVNSTAQGKVYAQVQVAGGDPIGFEKAQVGTLQAVAGGTRIPLSEGQYDWRYTEWTAALPSIPTGTVGKTLETARQPAADAIYSSLSAVGIVL